MKYRRKLAEGKPCPKCGAETCNVGKHPFHPSGLVCWKCTYGWPNIEDVPRLAESPGKNAPIDFESAAGDVTDAEGHSQLPAPVIWDGDEEESITKPSGVGGRGPESEAASNPARPLTAEEIFERVRRKHAEDESRHEVQV